MSREIEQDFQYTLQFLNQYTLETMISNPKCHNQIKCMHRKLYSFMVFLNEMERINCIDKVSLKYFKEVSTDLILTLFCWINGVYKSAKLQMRSSIENFLKATSYLEEPKVIDKKSVYEIFDIAESTVCYSNDFSKLRFNVISSEYSKLCATVHGALEKLCDVGGLIKFPVYDEIEAMETSNDFDKIISAYLGVIYFTYYTNIFQMHELNRDLFLQGLGKKEKSDIYNIKLDLE